MLPYIAGWFASFPQPLTHFQDTPTGHASRVSLSVVTSTFGTSRIRDTESYAVISAASKPLATRLHIAGVLTR